MGTSASRGRICGQDFIRRGLGVCGWELSPYGLASRGAARRRPELQNLAPEVGFTSPSRLSDADGAPFPTAIRRPIPGTSMHRVDIAYAH